MKTHTMLFVVAVCAAACVGADNAAVAGHGAGVNARQQAGAPHAHGAFPQAIGAEKLSMSLPYPSNPPIARVAIFQEQDPYGSTIIQNILASNGIAYTIFGTNDMGVVDLGPYDKVVIPSAQTTDFYARVQFHALWFQEYAFGGGIIEMHLASEAAQPVDGFFMPGGFLSVRYPTNAVTLGNADFPMLRRPHGIVNAMLQNWDSSAYGYFVFYPYGARRIVTIAGTNLPCAVDAPYGAGRIFATLQPVEWVFASQDYLENMLLYAGYNNVAILQDRIPWVNYVTNATYQNGMNERVLASNFIAYTIFGTSEMRFVDYSPYDKVIVAGDQGSNFYAQLGLMLTQLTLYASSGGLLDLHLAASSSEQINRYIYPGGFSLASFSSENVNIVDPGARILNVPNVITKTMLTNWSFSVHGYFAAMPAGAQELIEIAQNGLPCAAVVPYGAGRIFASVQPVEWVKASWDYLENTILDNLVGIPPPPLNVLVYADDLYHLPPYSYVDGALRSMGVRYTPFYSGRFPQFINALSNGGPWDAVLFANDQNNPLSNTFDALFDYVNLGGRLVAQSWAMRTYSNHPLWHAMGAVFVTNVPAAPVPIYWWDATNELFTTPLNVPMFTMPVLKTYGTYGQRLIPTNGGHAVAGYTSGFAVSNQAAIIIGQNGNTILRGFTDGQFEQDVNGNGRSDAEDLWVNIIHYFDVPEPACLLLAAAGLALLRRRFRR